MHVLPLFWGDHDKELARIQHDLYGKALFTLFLAAYERRHALRLSKKVIGSLEVARRESFDHRTLQETHDLVAGRFRFLSLVESILTSSQSLSTADAWSAFAISEFELLCQERAFARDVLLAVALANSEDGRSAEARLKIYLVDKYRIGFGRVEGLPLLPKETAKFIF